MLRHEYVRLFPGHLRIRTSIAWMEHAARLEALALSSRLVAADGYVQQLANPAYAKG